MSKKNEFRCPHCAGRLNPGAGIILLAVNLQRNEKGLLEASAQVGNHTVQRPKDLSWQKGEKIKINCPICHTILNLEKDSSKALILLKEEGKSELTKIIFSTIIDEHATYKLHEKSHSISQFGPDVSKSDKARLWEIIAQ